MLKALSQEQDMRPYHAIALSLCAISFVVTPQGEQNQSDHSNIGRGNAVDAGSMVEGKSYHSNYFGFTYSLPDGFVEVTEQYRSLTKKRSGVYSSVDTFILLHAERLLPNSEATVEITIMADRLSRYPRGATEKDYLYHLVTQPIKSEGRGTLLQEGKEMDVSDHKFFRSDYQLNGQPINGYETVMVTFYKGFALSWTLMAPSKTDLDTIIASVERALIAK